MSGKSAIEWTDRTSNPIRAVHKTTGKRGWFCTKVSPGCKHCYAERLNIWRGTGTHFSVAEQGQIEVVLDEKEIAGWAKLRKTNKIFLCDMTDLFGEHVPDESIERIFEGMFAAPRQTFQVLTKRAERMSRFITERYPDLAEQAPNVWLGVSVEDQQRANERVTWLMNTPAAVRFLSVEPMLGPVDLLNLQYGWSYPNGKPEPSCLDAFTDRLVFGGEGDYFFGKIHQVIAGGESGAGARPLHPNWLRRMRDDCKGGGAAFFFKQWGNWTLEIPRVWSQAALDELRRRRPVGATGALVSRSFYCFGDDTLMYRVKDKHAAGRELDGRTWDEFPALAE